MLRQIELQVQNGPITNNVVLPVTALFFKKFCSSLRTSCKELISFDVPTTQMLILVLFASAVVLFDCALSF